MDFLEQARKAYEEANELQQPENQAVAMKFAHTSALISIAESLASICKQLEQTNNKLDFITWHIGEE